MNTKNSEPTTPEPTPSKPISIAQSPIIIMLVAGGGLVLLVAGLRATASIINPFILAVIFAFVFGPVLGWMRSKGVPGALALLLTILIIVAGGILLILFLGASLEELVTSLPSYQSSSQEQTANLQELLADLNINIPSVFSAFDPTKLLGVIGNIVTEVVSAGAATIFMLFILAFMLFETLGMPRKLSQPRLLDNPFIMRFKKFGGDIRRYVLVLTWINLLVGLGDTIFLSIIGVDFAILWGLLAWFMGYIPSVGFWLALIPPVLLAYAEFGAATALIVFLGYVLINGTIQNVVQPKLMGDELNLSPLIVVASLFLWTWVLGPLGALIAVPMTMAVQQLVLGSSEGSMWLADLMGAAPPAPKDEDTAGSESSGE